MILLHNLRKCFFNIYGNGIMNVLTMSIFSVVNSNKKTRTCNRNRKHQRFLHFRRNDKINYYCVFLPLIGKQNVELYNFFKQNYVYT